MLKRIISGKAKAEDFMKESMKDDFYCNSIINNFLSDLLGRTSDEFINKRMKNFRSKIVEQKEGKKFPHVFSRLQTDIKRRKSIIDPNLKT